MRPILLLILFTNSLLIAFAGRIQGTISETSGKPLAFASVMVKGTTNGTTANNQGKYFLNLEAGRYTIIVQHVGYQRQEKTITIGEESVELNFTLSQQELVLEEVIVKRGEDPAYEIIREAIKKREYYNGLVDSFIVDVYIKGLLRTRAMPQKVFGQKIERDVKDGIDSAGRGIIFLSESMTKVSYKKPDKIKFEVLSSRQSGGGYGLSFPFFINFYVNNVSVFDNNLNPRGFISPIADRAIHYYKFKYEGSFVEDDRMVNRIKVTPRRKNEPLFSGYIHITEGDWRIHSLDLLTLKEYSLELIDTLRISQIHVPIDNEVWRTKDQVVYVAAKMMGFDLAGNFVNVYTNYNLAPAFNSLTSSPKKKYFDRVLMKYDTAFNKRDSAYWDQLRPIPLEQEEQRNFVFKDSIAKYERDSMYTKQNLDSLRKSQKPITLLGILWQGAGRTFYSKKAFAYYSIRPLIPLLEYNTVEGVAIKSRQSLNIRPTKGKLNYGLNLFMRYGVSNSHFNAHGNLYLRPKTEGYRNRYLKFAGGKRLSQFNNDNPIDPFSNTLYTLLGHKNYMKLYENWFGEIEYNNRFENGLRWNIKATYEDRIPVENTTDYSFFKQDDVFTPNHPEELANIPFNKHQALVASLTISYQPGQYYIQFPRHKAPIGSKYPTFELEYSKGISNLIGSDVKFDKWKFSVYDNMNFRIGGEFRYRLSVGGFLDTSRVEIPDMQHFNGNRTFYNFKYLNSFQLAPYYKYSNKESFYVLAHVEHHFNGLLTNKIPLFNKLKWNLVGGSNAFYVNNDNYYVELFAGLENIFKMFRVDFVTAYQPGLGNTFGVRVGLGGLLGGKMTFSRE